MPEEGRGCVIATTSTRHAADALDVLTDLGAPFAILHGAEKLGPEPAGPTSDIDLAVVAPPAVLVPLLARAFPEQGLHVVVQWNYDIGGATTLILSTGDAAEGVQLDLLCDVRGVGLDGVMTPWILNQRDLSGRWPCANALHETLYLIRKRHRKSEHLAVHALVERAVRHYPRDRLRVEAFKIFRGPVARHVCALLDGAPSRPPGPRVFAPATRLARWGQRLARPVGFWAECETTAEHEADVREVAAGFERFMPYTRAGRRPGSAGGSLTWFAREVAPVRWRPGLFVSSAPGGTSRPPRSDLLVERGASPREIRTAIVAAMAARVIAHGASVLDLGALETELDLTTEPFDIVSRAEAARRPETVMRVMDSSTRGEPNVDDVDGAIRDPTFPV